MKKSLSIFALVLAMTPLAAQETPDSSVQAVAVAKKPPTVLITGSSRGIGFELTKRYVAKGWRVIATCRTPSRADDLRGLARQHANVVIEEMDVTDHAEIEKLAAKYRETPIDVLINNAGIFGDRRLQTFDVLDYETFTRVMAVNVYGPLKVSQAFVDSVAASDQRKIVTITSGLGSMTLTEQRGDYYFYRISKAGVNIIGRTLAADLRDRDILIGLFNPGVVNTDFAKGTTYRGRILEPEEAVDALIGLIAGLNEENAAVMVNYDGTPMPW